MAKYYTKEVLTAKVKDLGDLIGDELKLFSCNGEYAISYKHSAGVPFSWAGWYHTAKDLIIYIDGVMDGIKKQKLQIN